MQIFPLSEGSFTIDQSKKFVPFDPEKDQMKERSSGSLLVEIQPFLVVTSKDIILLDTGLGFSNSDGKMQIHQSIIDAGFNPGDVTKVLMSHLHKDHAGGVSEDNDKSKLCFPDATYYVQRSEFDYATGKGTASYIPEDFEALGSAANVVFLEQTKGMIDDYIEYEITGAHSPFHQVFWLREEGEIIFFGADDAPQLQQMKHRFAAKYDHDGKKAMELRTAWWEKGQEEKWRFLFYHDIKSAVYPG